MPTCPPAKLLVVICNVAVAAATVIESEAVAVSGVAEESLVCTVNDEEPAAVGVPEIAPLEAFSANPAGSVPDAMLQAYGAIPPEAVSVPEYAFLSVA